jgi:arginyl-tRNA--protein-N-Asp/Glu arginylyltransferase
MQLAAEISRFVSPWRPCSYLPGETASLEYRVFAGMSSEDYAQRLARGWRRHGAHFFRPQCPACRQCRSLRVRIADFQPTRSQRRTLSKNSDITVIIGPPEATAAHVVLYNSWHRDMSQRRGWSPQETDIEDYENSFLIGCWPFAREMCYYNSGKLVGVGLVDVVDDALSSVYFYHDPAWRPAAPGVFSVLQEIEYCRATGRAYNYLGYWIAACPSMTYKCQYRPHEILEAYVDEQETPVWKVAETQSA